MVNIATQYTREKQHSQLAKIALQIPTLVAPAFIEYLIAVSQLTTKENKVLFTKDNCILQDPQHHLNKDTSKVKNVLISSIDSRIH